LPLRDTSPTAKMRPPKLASDPTNKRAFAEMSEFATTILENVFTPPMVCAVVVSTVLPFTPAIAEAGMEPVGKLTVPVTTRAFFTYTFPLRDVSPRTNKRLLRDASPLTTTFTAVVVPPKYTPEMADPD